MAKIEYLIVPKGTKYMGSDKLGLAYSLNELRVVDRRTEPFHALFQLDIATQTFNQLSNRSSYRTSCWLFCSAIRKYLRECKCKYEELSFIWIRSLGFVTGFRCTFFERCCIGPRTYQYLIKITIVFNSGRRPTTSFMHTMGLTV